MPEREKEERNQIPGRWEKRDNDPKRASDESKSVQADTGR